LPGKKLMTVRIVKHAFEIIHLLSGENPLQVYYCSIVDIVGPIIFDTCDTHYLLSVPDP
jgi:ribosomal protein S7